MAVRSYWKLVGEEPIEYKFSSPGKEKILEYTIDYCDRIFDYQVFDNVPALLAHWGIKEGSSLASCIASRAGIPFVGILDIYSSNEFQIDSVYRIAYNLMGFKDDKAKFLEDLDNLNFDHEARSGRVEEETLLAAGVISPKEAAEIVAQSRGSDYESRPHHQITYPPVWILKPLVQGRRWYVKGYFLADQTWFISFHPSNS